MVTCGIIGDCLNIYTLFECPLKMLRVIITYMRSLILLLVALVFLLPAVAVAQQDTLSGFDAYRGSGSETPLLQLKWIFETGG